MDKKNIIITGSSGMVGSLALENCLKRSDVNKVTILTRQKSGINHIKLFEIIHDDFMDYGKIRAQLKNHDVCIYCIGVYTGKVPADEFRKITVDYTQIFAQTLKSCSKKLSFCFLSGQGADSTEKSRMMFARDKGAAENLLLNLEFDQTHIFRPGYIFPIYPRKEPNLSYRIMRMLYKPLLSKVYPNIGVKSKDLARAMVDIGICGGDKVIYENKDIRHYNFD